MNITYVKFVLNILSIIATTLYAYSARKIS